MGKKYIDVDALKQALHDFATKERFCWTCDYDIILDIMEEQPTADVRPNVKGEWKSISYGKCPCSECGSEALYKVDWYESGQGTSSNIEKCKSNFCPNCGADMRGDK